MYTNVLQWVGDVMQQPIDPNTIKEDNFVPVTIIVNGQSLIFETFEGYNCFMKAIKADNNLDRDYFIKAAIFEET